MNRIIKNLVVAIFVFSMCLPVSAKVIIKEKTSYYTVSGNSGWAIKKAIQKHRIIGSVRNKQIGLTRTKMDVKNIKWKHRSGRCTIKHIDVVLDILYILPKWKKPKSSGLQLNKNWKKFASAIAVHEKTHGKIWKESYREMYRKIANLSFTSTISCDKFRSKIQKIVNDAENKGDKRNKNFERNEKQKSSAISRAFLKLVATK